MHSFTLKEENAPEHNNSMLKHGTAVNVKNSMFVTVHFEEMTLDCRFKVQCLCVAGTTIECLLKDGAS